jgi:2-phospho-L-lactate guanylyltransferase (CobY/MobA/RfbA family)
VEENRGRLVVILAGYPDQLVDFVRGHPRLKQHFTRRIDFPDYSPRELSEIFFAMCQRNNLVLADGMHQKVLHHFQASEAMVDKFSYNVELVRLCFDAVVEAQANRLSACEDIEAQNLNLLVMADLPAVEKREVNGAVAEANGNGNGNGAVTGHLLTTRTAMRVI